MPDWVIRLIEQPEEMRLVEDLQKVVWPGPDIEIVPKDLLLAVVHNGGLVIGAFIQDKLIGAVFGFPGFYSTPDGPRMKHHSHLLAVDPEWRSKGVGFALKRAQWQMVRKQSIDRITWTYDPLMSRNAYLNITRLGAVCNTYLRSEYGEMRDSLNVGLPSDRFQVDWWLNSSRVERRLGRRVRPALSVDSYRSAEIPLLEASVGIDGLPHPIDELPEFTGRLILAEIPHDFQALRSADLSLARDWRFYSREVFEKAFESGYLVTDLVHNETRSFYVLAYGDTTL
jgi:predicted GNAT superfamily acetyltransferase